MGKAILRDSEVIGAAVLAALGAYIFVQSLAWDYYTADGPGPGFFPVWYGVAMVVLSLALIVGRVRQASAAGGLVEWQGAGRALATWAAFALSVALMVPLGFFVSFALLTFFLVVFIFGRSPIAGLLTAAGLVIGFDQIFAVCLDLQLPAGYLGFSGISPVCLPTRFLRLFGNLGL
jgi:putative tricarboxylic transport membrane protein